MATSDTAAIADVLSKLSLPAGTAIRRWREEDFPDVQRLSAAEGWPTPSERPAEALQAWQRSGPTLVATHRGQIIGFVRALTDDQVTMYIAEFLVDAAWRGRGLGRALLDACHLLHPHTRQDLLSTDDAHAFYEASGFRQIPGFRKNYNW